MAFILSEEQTHTTPGIHAFLGLATLPRFQTQANPLRLLPREIIEDPVVFGVLVDMVRGCVTYRLNGLDGPSMKFPDYVRKARISVDRLPVAGDRVVPLVLSCATPPIPSSLRAAAANPLTAKEHIAAGTLEDVSDEIDLDYHDNVDGVDNVNDY